MVEIMAPLRLRVRELREALGLSQVQLAEQTGIRRATLIAIEQGRTSRVDFEVLEKLGRALGVAPGLLIVETGSGTKGATKRGRRT
jgi:transcriptional regulator with XRE-family HTH domain